MILLAFGVFVVLTAGNGMEEDVESFLAHGADHVMLKPVNVKEFLDFLVMRVSSNPEERRSESF